MDKDSALMNFLPQSVLRSLADKAYDRRKAAAIEVERTVREISSDSVRLSALLSALASEFAASPAPNARNGGLIALAAAAIALGQPALDRHLPAIVPPILACFSDHDARVRYYASEALYNVAKVARASILIYFNDIFDALCKLAVDPEGSVKSGAALLDRIIKDIVAERSAFYHPELDRRASVRALPPSISPTNASNSSYPPTNTSSASIVPVDNANHPLATSPPAQIYPPVPGSVQPRPGLPQTTFNLPRFIPLLAERIYAVAPAARIFLVQWIFLLHSIPDLELISYLPDFLDGLFRFLSDPNVDVRTATLNVLSEFLKEIRDVVAVHRDRGSLNFASQSPSDQSNTPLFAPSSPFSSDSSKPYVSGQGVVLSFGRMTKILVPHLSSQDEETQATALKWANEFLLLAKPSMIPFVPLILRPVLRTLSHSVPNIRNMASDTNASLFNLVLDWDGPLITANDPSHPINITAAASGPPASINTQKEIMSSTNSNSATIPTTTIASSSAPDPIAAISTATSNLSIGPAPTALPSGLPLPDPALPPKLDVLACVHILTDLFQDDREETRAAAIDWISMLHKKAPQTIIHAPDQRLFQSLLNALSDQSEEVVKRDLQLLAQISHASDDQNFAGFVRSLLTRFSSDRRLLESRGSLIIRQLCFSLSPDRMYRAFAELIELSDDLEFASIMVQNLNLILMTAPELTDLRRRLRHLDSRDGAILFTTLYRSWSHNAVAALSLCFLAQAYEHATSLVSTFGDLDITVSLLVQIDKLVQMLESPVFTYLRLQLLEPDRYPYLFKCLYGILMLLPQSSAFATLRNRLNSVGPLINLYHVSTGLASTKHGSSLSSHHHSPPTPQPTHSASRNSRTRASISGPSTSSSSATTSSHSASSDTPLRWSDLLSHFRSVQHRHERSYRHSLRIASTTSLDRSIPHASYRPKQDHTITSNVNIPKQSMSNTSLPNPVAPSTLVTTSVSGTAPNASIPPPTSSSVSSTSATSPDTTPIHQPTTTEATVASTVASSASNTPHQVASGGPSSAAVANESPSVTPSTPRARMSAGLQDQQKQ